MILERRKELKATEFERKIRAKMGAIKRGEMTPKESGIGVLFSSLLRVDLAMYEGLVAEYKKILNDKK